MMLAVLCLEHLHPFMADPRREDGACPVCGCPHFRLAPDRVPEGVVDLGGSSLTITVIPGRHTVGEGSDWFAAETSATEETPETEE